MHLLFPPEPRAQAIVSCEALAQHSSLRETPTLGHQTLQILGKEQ